VTPTRACLLDSEITEIKAAVNIKFLSCLLGSEHI
jgi:hypothetical protein